MTLGNGRLRQAELDAAPVMMVVASPRCRPTLSRVPALNKRQDPLDDHRHANSCARLPSSQRTCCWHRRGFPRNDRFVRTPEEAPVDLLAVISPASRSGGQRDGCIGRARSRCVAFEMTSGGARSEHLRGRDQKAAPPRPRPEASCLVDFVSVHCPKAPETVNMFSNT